MNAVDRRILGSVDTVDEMVTVDVQIADTVG
jgi:hypothetical protein